MKFFRYHALGNDYIVMRQGDCSQGFTPAIVRRICHRHFGVGSDGILVHQQQHNNHFALRIFNPDGSEAEKSGNGLRIFARYLRDQGLVGSDAFQVTTPGGVVSAQVAPDGREVTVEMGRISFLSSQIPVQGPEREVLNESVDIQGRTYTFCAASIGNPHCVVLDAVVTPSEARRIGPILENSELFPHRTNVQLLEVINRSTIRLEIWERGAGYTLASGSSSSAAAAVAHRLGLVDASVTVCMPGGSLAITLSEHYEVTMSGPVTHIADGEIDPESLRDISE
jgi:diaminopimelate epimerase